MPSSTSNANARDSIGRGQKYLQEREWTAAATVYDERLAVEPHSAVAWYGKACALDHLDDCDALAAIMAFEQARMLDPSPPPELASLLTPLERAADGRHALEEGRFEDALRAFDQALRIRKTSKAALLGKIQELRRLGKGRLVGPLIPAGQDPHFQLERGWLQLADQQYEEAARTFKEITIEPSRNP